MGNTNSTNEYKKIDQHEEDDNTEFINYAKTYDYILTKTALILMDYIIKINFFSKHTSLKTFRDLVLFFIDSDCLWEYKDDLKSLFVTHNYFSSQIFKCQFGEIYRIKENTYGRVKYNTLYGRVKYASSNLNEILTCIYNFLKYRHFFLKNIIHNGYFLLDISTDDLFEKIKLIYNETITEDIKNLKEDIKKLQNENDIIEKNHNNFNSYNNQEDRLKNLRKLDINKNEIKEKFKLLDKNLLENKFKDMDEYKHFVKSYVENINSSVLLEYFIVIINN